MYNYEEFFANKICALRAEGRYRRFVDLERYAGKFPTAFDHSQKSDVTVWCSNDYLGMGQHPVVLTAMHEAIARSGAGAGGKASSYNCDRKDLDYWSGSNLLRR
jgi:5-aminolevulinate synthase